MFAVVQTGGKQYRVEQGSVLDVERIVGEVGQEIELSEVLLIGDGASVNIGKPTVAGASVRAQILEQKRGPKLMAFRKLRRHGMRWHRGHRQELTRVRVSAISA